MRMATGFLFLLLILPSLAFAQAPTTVPLDLHFANSGSAAAQKPFMDGLALLHDFEYERAAKDFRQAEAIDPKFCMAYWGEAMSYNEPLWRFQDRRSAEAALNKLGTTETARLVKCGTQRER